MGEYIFVLLYTEKNSADIALNQQQNYKYVH